MVDLVPYLSVFASGFIAATLFPASSEAVLIGFLLAGNGDPLGLTLAAGVGNTSGGVVNWACGRFLAQARGSRWFPVSAEKLEKASGWFTRFGTPSLLFSWLPVVGDALTVAAGLLGTRLLPFVLWVGTGKTLRYGVVTITTLGLFA